MIDTQKEPLKKYENYLAFISTLTIAFTAIPCSIWQWQQHFSYHIELLYLLLLLVVWKLHQWLRERLQGGYPHFLPHRHRHFFILLILQPRQRSTIYRRMI